MKPVCECGCGREADGTLDGYASAEFRGVGLEGARFCGLCTGNSTETIAAMNNRIRAHRAAKASTAESQRFYGTQPAVLPETLPVGTRYRINASPCSFRIDEPARLLHSGPASWPYPHYSLPARTRIGDGERLKGGYGEGHGGPAPEHIDWSTVPVQEAKPKPSTELNYGEGPMPESRPPAMQAAAACENCRAPKHDLKARFCAYCVNGDADKKATNDAELQLRNDAARARMAAADRRATPRKRQRPTSPARESVAEGHPSTWPSQEGEP
jgi:hypothetical protein